MSIEEIKKSRENLLKALKEYKSPRILAEKLGVHFSTVYRWMKHYNIKRSDYLEYKGSRRGFDERAPKFTDKGGYYIIHASFGDIEIDRDELREMKALYCGEGHLTINEIALEFERPRREIIAIKTAFGWTHDDVEYLDDELLERDIDELVEETIQRKKRKYLKKLQAREIAEMKRKLDMYERKNYFYDKIAEVIRESNRIQPLPKTHFIDYNKEEKDLVIACTDWHTGKFIPPGVMINGQIFDEEVLSRRISEFIVWSQDLIKKVKPRRVFILQLGDSLDGPEGDVYPFQPFYQDLSGNSQIIRAKDNWVNFVTSIYEVSPELIVETISGNHSKREMVDFEELVYLWAKELLADYDIKYNVHNLPYVVVEINPTTAFIITHGQYIRDSSKSPLTSDVLSVARMTRANYENTYITMGHLHHLSVKEILSDIEIRRVPSIVGSDPFSQQLRLSSKPRQVAWEVTEQGIVAEHYAYFK